MSKNPVLNALAAIAYIVTIVLVMNWGTKFAGGEDTLMAPIAMISLFTLSAAVMAYLFCFQPIKMYLDGKKKQAVDLFLKTVGMFGGITIVMMILLFSGLFK